MPPTESRWEYACRAGTTARYFTGDDLASLKGFANIADVTYGKAGGSLFEKDFDDGFVVQAAIGVLKPNAFGLHDVHGNVWEWCLDSYDESAYGARVRVGRGGSFRYVVRFARSAYRSRSVPDFRDDGLGFRPALSVTTS